MGEQRLDLRARRAGTEILGARLGDLAEDIKPIIQSGSSDSAALDAVFEVLVRAGRNAPMAKTMLVPESWSKQAVELPQAWMDRYSYCNSVMEPWDGPAALAMTDGRWVAAGLDRNGLRPMRYVVTGDRPHVQIVVVENGPTTACLDPDDLSDVAGSVMLYRWDGADDLVEDLDGGRVLWEKQDLLRHHPDKLADAVCRIYADFANGRSGR